MNILITGASRGIGLATAKQLDTSKNKLFLVASSKDSFKDTFKNAVFFGADGTKAQELTRLAAEVAGQAESIDVLINNVGVMVMKKFEQLSEDDINLMLDLNLRSHMLLTHALLPVLRKSGNPQIVFMSSMAAKSSIVGESVYAATKGGITNFANVLRNELGPAIRVSAVHAWGVDTWGAPKPEEFIQPADIAATMEFIITRPPTVMVESIDLSNPIQWRGGQAPWSPV
ncbi:MAG TPA: SDR family oxidoreductase [Candidatus Saccharimonadales bacterium]|nr:SDR family oxidoreductase [Candidatus Saccharimonadales bacterium]